MRGLYSAYKVYSISLLLIRRIVVLSLGTLLLININPFYGGLALTGTIAFIMTYMLLLIQVISIPFHPAGSTRDDVSLFLLKETKNHLSKQK